MPEVTPSYLDGCTGEALSYDSNMCTKYVYAKAQHLQRPLRGNMANTNTTPSAAKSNSPIAYEGGGISDIARSENCEHPHLP